MSEEGERKETGSPIEDDLKLRSESRKNKRKKQLMKEAGEADKGGVCYLNHIPPKMDPLKLRQLLSQYGEIQRIYLTPENPDARLHRKRAGGYRGQKFSEGWVEFTKKHLAKKVAEMINGEQIGGRKRSIFYYDRWNIKYLSKFKWDDLTEEIAYKSATREQKLALDMSAAKRERDFYLSKVDQSRALKHIDERLQKVIFFIIMLYSPLTTASVLDIRINIQRSRTLSIKMSALPRKTKSEAQEQGLISKKHSKNQEQRLSFQITSSHRRCCDNLLKHDQLLIKLEKGTDRYPRIFWPEYLAGPRDRILCVGMYWFFLPAVIYELASVSQNIGPYNQNLLHFLVFGRKF